MKPAEPLPQLTALEGALTWVLACVRMAQQVARTYGPNRYTRECVRLAGRELAGAVGACGAMLTARHTRRRTPAKRKAPRLAGTGREGNSDAQTVAPAVESVNGLALGDAAQRQEVRDAH